MTWTPETLRRIIALQAAAHARDPGFGQRVLDALNRATLAEKAKMTPEAIAAEEESRRNHVFDPLTGRRRDTTGNSSP
jgi:hypothetical protein